MESVWINAGNSKNALIISDSVAEGMTREMLADPSRSSVIAERVGKVLAESLLEDPSGFFSNIWNFGQGAIAEITDAVVKGIHGALTNLNKMIESIGAEDPAVKELEIARKHAQSELDELIMFQRLFEGILADEQALSFHSEAVKNAGKASKGIARQLSGLKGL
jgi:hypothetical protein